MSIIEEKYQEYLKVVGLNYADMSYRQRTETRRAFYSGFDYSLRTVGDMMQLSDQKFDSGLLKIRDELLKFWKTEQLNQLNSN